MANETMRIFFPLKIVTYPCGEYGGPEDVPAEITPAGAVAHEGAIFAAKSLMWCVKTKSLRQKMLAAGDCAERERCYYGK